MSMYRFRLRSLSILKPCFKDCSLVESALLFFPFLSHSVRHWSFFSVGTLRHGFGGEIFWAHSCLLPVGGM